MTHILESYILQRWRLDARHKNVAIEYGIRHFLNQGTRGTARLWIMRTKFNAILEMVSDSDIHLSKLDAVLERFVIETSNDFKFRTLNDQSSQSETNVGSIESFVILRDGKKLTIRDPIGPMLPRGGLKVHPG